MDRADTIYRYAASLGFDRCAVTRSRPLSEHRAPLAAWLHEGRHGELGYMERNFEKRLDPAQLVAGARSVVVCAMSYHRPPADSGLLSRIASYAWGRDYHEVLKERLHLLLKRIEELYPGASGRVFVDTAPILEKAWAVEAGLGGIGRNSLLIVPSLGSFVLLGVIVTDAELAADDAELTSDTAELAPNNAELAAESLPKEKNSNLYAADPCGSCRACISACPAGAILDNRTIDASRCIARRTIEHAAGDEGDLHGWIFGCDVCQRACPHNRHAPVVGHEWFAPAEGIAQMTEADWLELSEAEFARRFGPTPLSRCGLARIQSRIRETAAEPTE